MTRYLKQILLPLFAAAAIAALMLPVLNEWLITPSFTRYFKENTRNEALLVAEHLSNILLEDKDPSDRDCFTAAFGREAAKVTQDFDLVKLKVFSASGEIVYSSDHEDIGSRNEKKYFHDVVAFGNTYTKLVNKGTGSLEDQVFSADVAETYVPIMDGETFLGAFEIYYDVSSRLDGLKVLLDRTKAIVFAISIILLTAAIFSFLRARRALEARRRSTEEVRQARLKLAQRVTERTAELNVANKQLQLEVLQREDVERELRRSEENFKSLAENASDAIFISRVENGKHLYVNAMAAELTGYSLSDLAQTGIKELMVPDEPRATRRVGGRGVMVSAGPRRYSATVTRQDGSERAVETAASSTTWHGQRAGLFIVREVPDMYRENAKREKLIRELRISLEQAHVLSGFIPICAYCKKIRDDQGAWHQLEEYFSEHSEVVFTHGMCPGCLGEFTL